MKPNRRPAPLRRLGRQTHVESKWIHVHCDELLLDTGRRLSHWVVDYQRTGVGIVPVTPAGKLLLGLHYRPTVDRWGWEIAAGGGDADEDLAAAARRELVEETGHDTANLELLGEYCAAPGLGNERFVLYLARDLFPVPGAQLDADEIHELSEFTWDDFMQAVRTGDIFDGMSVTGVLWWRTIVCRG